MGFQEGLFFKEKAQKHSLSLFLSLPPVHTLSLCVLGMEKSLPWYGASWYETLELGANCLWAFDIWMFWASGPAPCMDKSAMGLEDAGPTRGLHPTWMGAHSCRQGPKQRYVCLPGLQPLGHRDPAQQGTRVRDSYMETGSSAPQILKGRAAARGC